LDDASKDNDEKAITAVNIREQIRIRHLAANLPFLDYTAAMPSSRNPLF